MLRFGPQEWNLQGDLASEIVVAGVRIEALGRLDQDELGRRRVGGPPPGTLGRRQLIALSRLPYGRPVPWAEIDLETRLEFDCLPPGAIRACAGSVSRVWQPPVDVIAVQVDARWPGDGVEAVSLFAAVAPRLLRLPSEPLGSTDLSERAAHLGIGVYRDGRSPIALTAAPSLRHVREDARRWELAEVLYAAHELSATARLAPAAT